MSSSSLPAQSPVDTDAVIIGAGPAGLFQVFQLGLQDIRAHVVDALPHPGGQCAELYADKPIYDIPALPACSGHELVARLLKQIRPMQATFHLDQEVTQLQQLDDGRWRLVTSQGLELHAHSVIVAAGVGAFQPRLLALDGIETFRGRQLHYRMQTPDQFAGLDLVVHGGEEGAVEHALLCAEDGPARARSVTLLHRRDSFRAAPEQLERLEALRAAGRIQVIAGQISAFHAEADQLRALQIELRDGSPTTLPLQALLVQLGISPRLGPIAEWGLELERKQLVVDPATCRTSAAGVYAVGDIVSYPGKKKLILCGFHEATMAAFAVAAQLRPDDRSPLQYTTTSPRLQQLLGPSAATST